MADRLPVHRHAHRTCGVGVLPGGPVGVGRRVLDLVTAGAIDPGVGLVVGWREIPRAARGAARTDGAGPGRGRPDPVSHPHSVPVAVGTGPRHGHASRSGSRYYP
ncbi:hypothetical protein Ae505Ps2_3692 [Pseudonocardia sp. Ae505_Ps2]|nr:hypothetical protein Ae505Ps2_3692 [Pseudonocardia sp. Ae505_Ps2]